MLVWVIIGCEVGFWVLLGIGLLVRYGLRMRRLSTALLVSVPLLDVVLLVASVIDMQNGATAGPRHALAAIYLGYSVVFGHQTIRWVDSRIAHRFANGPKPTKPPKDGFARLRHEIVIWVKIVAAYAIAWAVGGLLIVLVDEPERTRPLVELLAGAGNFVVIAAIWPISYLYSAVKGHLTGEESEPTREKAESVPARRS
ncbi:hypothetical protein [Stackebrandtia soli]|uniref:hypothetical protein n=1 Tax=Stackebrandtia soli TaxID=1892856 RepID=UPI0039ED8BB0